MHWCWEGEATTGSIREPNSIGYAIRSTRTVALMMLMMLGAERRLVSVHQKLRCVLLLAKRNDDRINMAPVVSPIYESPLPYLINNDPTLNRRH
jgi:hypothetical protein